jgi:predicted 2-oxoglutarate/Fe(II)-dependent dioxygenase YbiX
MQHIKNVLDSKSLSHIHALLADVDWNAGRESAGAQAAALKNNEQLSHDSQAMRDIRAIVLAAFDRHTQFFSATGFSTANQSLQRRHELVWRACRQRNSICTGFGAANSHRHLVYFVSFTA